MDNKCSFVLLAFYIDINVTYSILSEFCYVKYKALNGINACL